MIRALLKKFLGESFTEYNEKYIKYNFLIIVISFCAFFALMFFLPDSIPVLHQGNEMIYVPKTIGVFIPPVIITIINFSFMIQKRINKFNTILLAVVSAGAFIYYISLR